MTNGVDFNFQTLQEFMESKWTVHFKSIHCGQNDQIPARNELSLLSESSGKHEGDILQRSSFPAFWVGACYLPRHDNLGQMTSTAGFALSCSELGPGIKFSCCSLGFHRHSLGSQAWPHLATPMWNATADETGTVIHCSIESPGLTDEAVGEQDTWEGSLTALYISQGSEHHCPPLPHGAVLTCKLGW